MAEKISRKFLEKLLARFEIISRLKVFDKFFYLAPQTGKTPIKLDPGGGSYRLLLSGPP